MIFNYIHVSTVSQNIERQLKEVHCDREFIDRAAGKDTNRSELNNLYSDGIYLTHASCLTPS